MPDDTTPPPELTAREEEVSRHIAWGHSNKQIAARLYLSVKTVETYKARAMKKLGSRGRVDLVRYAVRRGWMIDGADPGRAAEVTLADDPPSVPAGTLVALIRSGAEGET